MKPKLWKYYTFCTISKPKLWYYHAVYRVSKPKLWYLHNFSFSTQFEDKTVICLHFLHTCEATSWYYHTICTVWNLKLWYDHMFWIVFEPKVWYYQQFFIVSLEIKPMMFLHFLLSFGSKTVKLPHVLTFLFNFT